ncbi:mannose-1-phosphate guanylyltransferase/mannose-6-phosphate isomerase [Zooshikella ganghwensis]|uniref:mannose-1-phosphate guanylyltransferase n=1 Tax=Zooshikella ganghwensis TaxID=202772 RepID=A0A4P9VLR4_9GAMM|nr:mannose-1-phosphate guanylyltransferase/mannose-6-phosphate isomerase [Zooshikella ganghwensis]RDH44308.1 mannose-1-phosphate guanylyltransferase/mannose-6-phosphate isomerase [Zooshikella ganghwensis]
MLIPVILSGGTGSRLWPLSRELYPKQLLNLVNQDTSLLQDTVLRLPTTPDIQAPIVVCNEAHRFMVAEQLHAINKPATRILLEPIGRNTAPAIAIAAWQAMAINAEAVLLVLPADHTIANLPHFHQVIAQGNAQALAGKLVTFGIVPDYPETGYGYIDAGEEVSTGVRHISQFVEKPSAEVAKQYCQSGHHFWNSGMFMFRADRYLQELKQFAPQIHQATQQAFEQAIEDLDFVRLDQKAFAGSPEDSIDYAVMEHTQASVVIPADLGWSDVGSWTALADLTPPDAHGNVQRGDVLVENTSDCYIRAEHRLVTTVGVSNLVIVETKDAVLVANKDQVQSVKQLVNQLASQQRTEYQLHKQVYRPWGSYEGIDEEDRFQVKRITVKPGASLSLQKHFHRAEHWIVVKGTAKVTCGEKTFLVSENESTYIPLGEKHRLENPGKIPLELIEVQSGSYLGEDDIVRFDDVYGRSDQQ